MKILRILVLFSFLVSCAPIYVTYDYEQQTDFSTYKTYNYYVDINTGLNEFDTKRLLDILDQQLQTKGLSLSETPDFFIDIMSVEIENTQRNTVGVGVGGGGRNVGGGISIGLPVGQAKINREIIFEFRDERGPGLIWQAISQSSYNPNSTPEGKEARLRAIIEKVLKGFPPKQK